MPVDNKNTLTKNEPDIKAEKKNAEGYPDPTAFEALNRLDEDTKVHKIMKIIFMLLDLTGFYMDGRITLVSKKTGRTWN